MACDKIALAYFSSLDQTIYIMVSAHTLQACTEAAYKLTVFGQTVKNIEKLIFKLK